MLKIPILFIATIILLVILLRLILNSTGKVSSTATDWLIKKFPHANMNIYSKMFTAIGLTVSLSYVLWAFEYKTYDESGIMDLGQLEDDFEDLMEIPPTEIPPPPPPKIQIPEIIEVPDEEEIEEEIDIELDVEVTEETIVEEIVFEEAPEEEVVDEIFDIVEDQPEFPGGISAFYKFVGKTMKYPKQARRMGIEGKVYVRFIVDKDGSVTNVEAVKGIGAGCDEEAVRVLKSSPKFKPGKQRGRPVKVRMMIPIIYKLSR